MTWNGINYKRREPDPEPDPRIDIGETIDGLSHFRCRICGNGSWLTASDIHHGEDCLDPRKKEATKT